MGIDAASANLGALPMNDGSFRPGLRHAVAVVVVIALAVWTDRASGQTTTWNTTSGTWSNSAGWTNGVPTSTGTAVFVGSASTNLTLDTSASIKSLSLAAGNGNSSFVIASGGSLVVDGGAGSVVASSGGGGITVTQTNSAAANVIQAAVVQSRGLTVQSINSTQTAFLTIESGQVWQPNNGTTPNGSVNLGATSNRNSSLTLRGTLNASVVAMGVSASTGTNALIIEGGTLALGMGSLGSVNDGWGIRRNSTNTTFEFRGGTISANSNRIVAILNKGGTGAFDIKLSGTGTQIFDTTKQSISIDASTRLVDLTSGGSVQVVGSSTTALILQGANTYTGDTVISSGILRVQNVGATAFNGTISGGAITGLPSTAGLFVGQRVSGSGITDGAVIASIDSSSQVTITGATTAGATSGTFAAANGTLEGSTLNYNSQGGVFSFGLSTALTLGGLKGNQNLALTNDAAAAVALTLGGNNQSTTYSGVLSGSGSLTKAGTGVLTLSGANTFSGSLTVADGSLAIASINNAGSNGVLGNGVSAVVLGSSGKRGTLSYTGASASSSRSFSAAAGGTAAFEVTNSASTLTLSGLINGDGDKTFGGPGSFVLSGSVAGTGGVFKTGAGSLTLSGSGHAGSFTIQEGRLNINAANALGASSGSLSLAGGVSLDNTSGVLVTIGNAKPIGLGASLNFLGSNSLSMGSGAVTLSGNAAIDVAANTLTFGGDVVGTGYGITKTGAGTLVLGGLSGSNSYTGNTRIQGGRLQLTGLSVMGGGSSTVVTIDQGAYLEVGPTAGVGNVTINTWTGGLITSGTINASVKYTTSGTLGTSDSLVNGVQTIGSGAVISSSSDLFGTNPNAPVAGRIVMENNSRLRATTGFTMSANKGIQLNSGTAIFESASGQLVLPNVISGAGGLVKTGTGAMTLSGNNSYAGTTTVEAGTLVVNGSLGAGNLTVQSGATLKGNGTINGFTTIDGVHSPGNSPGLETFTNGLSYGSASVLVWELSANTALASDRGSLYDGIDLTGGALSIASGATLNLVFNAALSNGGGLSTVDWDDPFWASSQTWKVIDVQSGAWTPGVFTLGSIGADASGQAFTSSIRSGATFSVSQGNDGSIYVNYVIVPEPDTVIFAGIGIAIAGWSLWKRRRTI